MEFSREICHPGRNTPWNKGKLIGAKPPLRPKHVCRSAPSCKSRNESAIWRCSMWPSTASCAAAMSSPSRSRTLLQMDMRLDILRVFCRRLSHTRRSLAGSAPSALSTFAALSTFDAQLRVQAAVNWLCNAGVVAPRNPICRQLPRLLRARHKRPGSNRATEQRDELAPFQ